MDCQGESCVPKLIEGINANIETATVVVLDGVHNYATVTSALPWLDDALCILITSTDYDEEFDAHAKATLGCEYRVVRVDEEDEYFKTSARVLATYTDRANVDSNGDQGTAKSPALMHARHSAVDTVAEKNATLELLGVLRSACGGLFNVALAGTLVDKSKTAPISSMLSRLRRRARVYHGSYTIAVLELAAESIREIFALTVLADLVLPDGVVKRCA